MKRLALVLAPVILFALPACDQAEGESSALRSADDDQDSPDGEARGHKSGHRGHFAFDRFCDAVDCSDDQQTQLQALMTGVRGHRGDSSRDARKAKRQATNTKLANAFRGEVLDTAALAEVEAAMLARHADKQDMLAAAIVKAHGILTAEQRETAAGLVDTFAPMMTGHGGPDDSEQRGKHGKHRRGDMAGHIVERLCAKIECQDDQAAQIATALKDGAPKPTSDEIKAVKDEVTAALRADTIDASTVQAIMARVNVMKRSHKPRVEAMLSEVHTILTAEQRGIVADTLRDEGPRALMGGRRHGKRGHGKRGRHG